MLTRFSVLLGVLLMCGCSSVETIRTEGDAQSIRKMNRDLRGQVVRMELHSGETMHVTSLYVESDSVTWIDGRSNTLRSERTVNIRELSVRKAGKGALVGLAAGVVVGAGIGVVRAVAEGDDPASDPIGATREEKVRIYPPAHAVYTSLISTPIGAALGSKKSYRFESPHPQPELDAPAAVTRR